MKVRSEFKAIDLNRTINETGYGEREIKDPVMIYAQIPIEREEYLKLIERCREEKTSIFRLMEHALDPNPEEFDFF